MAIKLTNVTKIYQEPLPTDKTIWPTESANLGSLRLRLAKDQSGAIDLDTDSYVTVDKTATVDGAWPTPAEIECYYEKDGIFWVKLKNKSIDYSIPFILLESTESFSSFSGTALADEASVKKFEEIKGELKDEFKYGYAAVAKLAEASVNNATEEKVVAKAAKKATKKQINTVEAAQPVIDNTENTAGE